MLHGHMPTHITFPHAHCRSYQYPHVGDHDPVWQAYTGAEVTTPAACRGFDPDIANFYGTGPTLSDIALHDLSAPLESAAADPSGCAALHPSATYAVRLLFDSAVRERAVDGSLVPFGTDATAAASVFSARTGDDGETPSPDQVVGVAGVPGGSAVDVCMTAAGGEPQVEAVVITSHPAAPLSPAGYPCSSPIVRPEP